MKLEIHPDKTDNFASGEIIIRMELHNNPPGYPGGKPTTIACREQMIEAELDGVVQTFRVRGHVSYSFRQQQKDQIQ